MHELDGLETGWTRCGDASCGERNPLYQEFYKKGRFFQNFQFFHSAAIRQVIEGATHEHNPDLGADDPDSR